MRARRRILIVDDETKVAFFLQESLEALGHDFEVLSVSSTEEALREVNRKGFDVLVTDQRMPDMDGLALIKQIQERYPETRFILITAYGSEDVLTKAQQLGIFRYFTKPFHIEDFVQTVLEALQKGPDQAPGESFADSQVDALSSRLEELRREVGAQCVLASGSDGALVAQTGVPAGLDLERLLRLAADGIVSSLTMTQHLGGNQPNNLNYHGGTKYDVYTASVQDDLFLVIVFDRRLQTSRIGIVWLYAHRAIEGLRRLMTFSSPRGPKDVKKSAKVLEKLASVDQAVG